MTQFDIILDIFVSSGLVSWIDFEEETPFAKGAIHFGYEGKRFEIIFNDGKIENFMEVS